MPNISPTPTPGFQYEVKEGESLSLIAGMAYGDIHKWPIIYRANLTTLTSEADPDLIFPKEIIIIPLKEDFEFQNTLTGKEKDDLTIIIDGIVVPVTSARIIRTMNSASDAWVAVLPWNPAENNDFDEATKPYQYPLAAAYLGGQLKVGGILYGVSPNLSAEGGRSKKLSGFSFTADAIDSNIKPPYEVNNTSLKNRAEDLLNPLGISVSFPDAVDPNAGVLGDVAFTEEFKAEIARLDGTALFSRVTASPQDTIFDHLANLAAKRSLLMSSDEQGNVIFLRANTDGSPIGTIEEDSDAFTGNGALEYVADFDGRKRWNAYKLISQSPGNSGATAVAKDNQVSRQRIKNIQVRDVIEGELKDIAEWEKNKTLAKAFTIPFPVSSWYGPDSKLWKENTLITIKSPTLFCPNGFTFLIQQVEFIYEASGISAVLGLVPPTVYSKEELVEPWG